MAFFEKAFAKGDILYLGMFNENRLPRWAALMKASSLAAYLQYIVLHPANRRRGLAPKFVKQVTDIERKGNTKFVPGCGAIHRILAMYELI